MTRQRRPRTVGRHGRGSDRTGRFPRRTWRAAGGLAATCLAIVLASCTPLYLPPVPADLPPIPERTRIAEVRVDRLGGTPTVVLIPRQVPEEGWLEIQWYGPAGGAVASTSVWLDEERVGRTVRLPFPDDVPRERQGRWRAVLSMHGEVLRQVEWSEPGTGRPPGDATAEL